MIAQIWYLEPAKSRCTYLIFFLSNFISHFAHTPHLPQHYHLQCYYFLSFLLLFSLLSPLIPLSLNAFLCYAHKTRWFFHILTHPSSFLHNLVFYLFAFLCPIIEFAHQKQHSWPLSQCQPVGTEFYFYFTRMRIEPATIASLSLSLSECNYFSNSFSLSLPCKKILLLLKSFWYNLHLHS